MEKYEKVGCLTSDLRPLTSVYSFPLIFNNLNNSTTIIGENTNKTTSNICSLGKSTKLNMFLICAVNKIINISAADTTSASNSVLLLNGFVLNIDLWLFLTLNICTSSDSAST